MVFAAALAALNLVGGIYQGIQSNNQAKSQAKTIQNNANEAADLNDYNTNLLRERQKLLFAASGFSLEGSPALILQDTTDRGNYESNKIRSNGRRQARQLRSAGRNALVSGFLQGAKQAVSNNQQVVSNNNSEVSNNNSDNSFI